MEMVSVLPGSDTVSLVLTRMTTHLSSLLYGAGCSLSLNIVLQRVQGFVRSVIAPGPRTGTWSSNDIVPGRRQSTSALVALDRRCVVTFALLVWIDAVPQYTQRPTQ